jgi:hypothetical protein
MHPIFVNVTLYPALHIVTTERRECEARPGMMCVVRVPEGSTGRSRVHV